MTAECSVMKPLTNSDSASAKSKGALLVSATAPIKNIRKIGNNGTKNQTVFCASIFTVKFKLLVNNITNNIEELNRAVLLNEPKKAYLELADQPASKIP